MEKNNAAGPGSVEDQGIAPKPLLEGATAYEVVTVFNPLSVDFYGMVGQDKPVNLPFEIRRDSVTNPISTTEADVKRNYGLDLKNRDHNARLPITNKVLIRSGSTLNLFGNEAQVVVRQLVNEIMQREGKKLLLADPYQRSLVENRVVRSRRSTTEAIGGVDSVTDQMRAGVDKLNEQENEAFPELRAAEPTAGFAEGSGNGGDAVKRSPSRPKADSTRAAAATV
jgi:hypothetical protein